MNPGQLEYRILVVEDVPDIQRLITRLLQEEGAEVVVAEDGQVAVERVREAQLAGRPFHCVLMDVKMPVLGGCEAARHVAQGLRGSCGTTAGDPRPCCEHQEVRRNLFAKIGYKE